MAASYDDQGNYLYPEGFDPETGEWLEGYEEQRAAWEQQYAEAHARWEAHKKQVEDAEAHAPSTSSYSSSDAEAASPAPPVEGSLASDEALQACGRSSPAAANQTGSVEPDRARARNKRGQRRVGRARVLWSPTGREPATESACGWA